VKTKVPKKIKVHSLTGRITMELMEKAFKAVKRNRGAAGIDRMTIEKFEENLLEKLATLMVDLKQRTYKPQALRRKYIPKGDGSEKLRALGIPTVRCRISQEVIRQLLSPTFERIFHQNSYGFRPGRNCHQAIVKVQGYLKEGYHFVLDADIKGFFDNIPHKIIMTAVAAEIADGNVLQLCEKFLQAGVMEDGKFHPTTKGTPQGGVVSPLLANAVLNKLDTELDKRGYRFVRYADDFVILCKTEQLAHGALEIVQDVMEELGLELSPEKTHITHAKNGFEFLGFFITLRHAKMREKSIEKFKQTLRELTTRSRNLDARVIEKLNQVIRGTVNYFATPFTHTLRQYEKLDLWLRRRIRCMKYKRISIRDNFRMKRKHINRLGLLSCRCLSLKRTRGLQYVP